jgi:hypothetical protein
MTPNGRGVTAPAKTISQQHAEWVGMLRPDGPFIAIPQLTSEFPAYLDKIESGPLERLRLAWSEVTEAPDTLTPAWTDLVLREFLAYTGQVLGEGASLPSDLVSGPGVRPDGVVYGPDGSGGRVERLYLYRRPYDESLTTATRQQVSPAEQAAALCRDRGVPVALLTNGSHWVLVHARPNEAATTADWDADLWLEERDLLRAFTTLLRATSVASGRLAELFAKSAAAQAEVTDKLGDQVRQAVELLVGELTRLDREADGALLSAVEPRQIYRGALTVMMRLVFLLYAEERKLLPVDSDLYADSYSVTALFDQLQAERSLYGDQVAGLRAAAWPRLLATFAAIHGGCENDQMRIPPYGGGLFDPLRYLWLDRVAVTDLVTAEILRSLVILRRKGAAERLSYKGLDVEQIGHVYEGLLEFSCLRIEEPYLGLIGKLEPELPLSEVESARNRDDFEAWLNKKCDATPAQIRNALDSPAVDEPTLDAACDNDRALSAKVWPLRGLLRLDLRDRPTVFPAGSLVITQTGDRRATGTHYTPRKLANEIVQYTLEPLCYNPGPADGVAADEANVRRAEELLELKVLDPAMGSAAFLVSACRYLSERVVSAWERDGYPDSVLDVLGSGFDRDDALLEARRTIAARCLYGVDRDEAAVELGKLSLWLVTLAKGMPFSFLDHALRHGDSLVGLTSESQVTAFHLDPATGHAINARLEGEIDKVAGSVMAKVKELRREIAKEPLRDAALGATLTAKLIEADRLTERLRVAADAVAAAALSTAGQPEDAFDGRLTALSEDVQALLHTDQRSPMEQAFRERLEPWLKGRRPEPIRPFHWPLEFPEVMDIGGFSAVVSNPPFMGGQTLTKRIGEDYREYLVNHIGRGKRGSADLCSYFLLRDLSIARKGRVGIIATNTIAQGDTREVGLDQVVADLRWIIYRADKSRPWEGTAAVVVSLLWLGHAKQVEQRVLDHAAVLEITPSLDPESRVTGKPYQLKVNEGKSFQGSNVLGKGFILNTQAEVDAIIAVDPNSGKVIFPYLNGEDLNSRPDCSASRWVINFGEMTDTEASRYSAAWDRVVNLVRPFRAQNNDRRRREIWWQFTRPTTDLYEAVANLDRVLVIAQTSRTQMPALVPRGQVFDQKLVVFPSTETSDLAFRASAFQYWWTVKRSSTMKTDTVYAPSDCCDTLPCPQMTARLSKSGHDLDTFRPAVMVQHKVGLTELYDLVGDEKIATPDFIRLRQIHVEIDEAVREAYALDEDLEPQIREFEARIASAPLPSWREIDLDNGFHDTPQGTRFTISPQSRVDVLDKLLALNQYRYGQEVQRGLHTGRRSRTRARAAGAEARPLDDGGHLPPPGALF